MRNVRGRRDYEGQAAADDDQARVRRGRLLPQGRLQPDGCTEWLVRESYTIGHCLQCHLDSDRYGHEQSRGPDKCAPRLPAGRARFLHVLHLGVGDTLLCFQAEAGRASRCLVRIRFGHGLHDGGRDLGDVGRHARHGQLLWRTRWQHGHPAAAPPPAALSHGPNGQAPSPLSGAADPHQGHGFGDAIGDRDPGSPLPPHLRLRDRLPTAD
mmetsp:Transcript_64822/g.200735  ORF Transcript_64822/g.200735 Transcript_64822/m.200735 type:complete len:211 (+) Transcript_64822:224-856(+)